MESKRETTKLTQRILNGTYGKEAQFICEYTKTHLVTLESLVDPSGYDDFFKQFLKCSSDYIDRLKPCDATANQSELIELGPSTLTKKKNDKILEKYRTPLCERTNFVVNKPSITINEERLSLCESESSNAKKRSAFAADISPCLTAEESEEDNESIKLVKVKLFKEKKKTKKGDVKQEEPEVEESSLNPSKKIRLVDELPDEPKTSKKSKKSKKIVEEIEEVAAKSSKKKVSKKKKGTKSKKIQEPDEDLNATDLDADNIKEEKEATTSKKTKKSKKSKKTKESIASEDSEKEKLKKKEVRIDNRTLKSVSKTPATNSTHRRMSRILLQSAIRNSTNKSRRPITRRAAAEAAKNEPTTSKQVTKPANPIISALKKAEGVPMKSPVKKLITKYETISNTPVSATKNRRINFDKGTPTTISRVKTKNPIDDRKIRASLQRLEAKRKSTKKAQEFLAQNMSKKESLRLTDEKKKKLSKEDREASNSQSTSSSQSNSDKDEDTPKSPTKKDGELSVIILTEKDQNIVDSILKSGSPKLHISKIPVGIITGGQRTSVSAAAFLAEQKRRLTKDFETNPVPKAIIQNTITKMQTPSKPSSSHQITAAVSAATATAIKPMKSFASFLERNTPSKMSRTEMEDKKKAELFHKETKEKERLQEQERQKQEKRDESKRKREEKLKKINEVKQKKELELEQKRKEIEQQKQTIPKIPSSTSNNSIMHKSVLNNTTNTHVKPMLTKKPIESSKPTVMVKKLSIAEQEIIDDFANKFGKLKQIQNPHESTEVKPTTKPNYASEYETQSLTKLMHNHQQNLEQTYVLKSPPNPCIKPITNQSKPPQTGFTNYEVTPLQPPKLKDIDNYDVSTLGSEDDTDDDEEPSKPIPSWATQQNLVQKVKQQNFSMVNFTRLFRSASQAEINLEKIFKTKRRKFTERSSSANWTCPPVWNGQGLTGDESFRTFRK